jgi:hypothetical protein
VTFLRCCVHFVKQEHPIFLRNEELPCRKRKYRCGGSLRKSSSAKRFGIGSGQEVKAMEKAQTAAPSFVRNSRHPPDAATIAPPGSDATAVQDLEGTTLRVHLLCQVVTEGDQGFLMLSF